MVTSSSTALPNSARPTGDFHEISPASELVSSAPTTRKTSHPRPPSPARPKIGAGFGRSAWVREPLRRHRASLSETRPVDQFLVVAFAIDIFGVLTAITFSRSIRHIPHDSWPLYGHQLFDFGRKGIVPCLAYVVLVSHNGLFSMPMVVVGGHLHDSGSLCSVRIRLFFDLSNKFPVIASSVDVNSSIRSSFDN